MSTENSALEQALANIFSGTILAPPELDLPATAQSLEIEWYEGKLVFAKLDEPLLPSPQLVHRIETYVASHIPGWNAKQTQTTLGVLLGHAPTATLTCAVTYNTQVDLPVDALLRGDRITAWITSDVTGEEYEFNAVQWFEQASVDSLEDLDGTYVADEIAYASADKYPDIEAFVKGGFQVRVDAQQAREWIQRFRPDVALPED